MARRDRPRRPGPRPAVGSPGIRCARPRRRRGPGDAPTARNTTRVPVRVIAAAPNSRVCSNSVMGASFRGILHDFAIRAALVSGRRAESTAAMPSFFADAGKTSHATRAAGTASSAAARSSGSRIGLGVVEHRPRRRSPSRPRRPHARLGMSPAASSSIEPRLVRRRPAARRTRGANHNPPSSSSNVRTGPSIHPKQSA